MRLPLLLFIVIPFIEIMLLLKVSEHIGALYTIALVLTTAFIGVNLLKRQGLSTLLRFQDRLRSGEIPAQEIVEGMLIAFSGALLLTPGFLTDAIGFTCLLPPVRRLIAQRILRSGNVFFMGGGTAGNSSFYYRETRGQDGHTFEGEFRDETRPRPTLEERDDD
ncbi:MAG: FxsA family protein [Pseudomonadales bacterium]|nr:FxsA family protein [Pseudomonadales bacterium]MCP5358724.1 FxsA family protein [Pseudomonadales bacterium]